MAVPYARSRPDPQNELASRRSFLVNVRPIWSCPPTISRQLVAFDNNVRPRASENTKRTSGLHWRFCRSAGFWRSWARRGSYRLVSGSPGIRRAYGPLERSSTTSVRKTEANFPNDDVHANGLRVRRWAPPNNFRSPHRRIHICCPAHLRRLANLFRRWSLGSGSPRHHRTGPNNSHACRVLARHHTACAPRSSDWYEAIRFHGPTV